MAFEVEVKARVGDPAGVKTVLEERYGQGRAFYKSDVYFAAREGMRVPLCGGKSPPAPEPAGLSADRQAVSGSPLRSLPLRTCAQSAPIALADIPSPLCGRAQAGRAMGIGATGAREGGATEDSFDPLFRLRSEGNARHLVTAKKKNIQEGVEINEEIEFSIDDQKAFRAFCDALGYEVSIEKTKNGSVWRVEDNVSIELARIAGLGDFVEIEALVEKESEVPAAQTRVRELLLSLGFGEQDIEPRYYIDMLRARHTI